MDILEFEINRIVSEWNPIGVDENIAPSEYVVYVSQIKECLDDRQALMRCMIKMLDGMNLSPDLNNGLHMDALHEVCSKLQALKQ